MAKHNFTPKYSNDEKFEIQILVIAHQCQMSKLFMHLKIFETLFLSF